MDVTSSEFRNHPFSSFQPRFTPEGDEYLLTVNDGVQVHVYLVPLPAPGPVSPASGIPMRGNGDNGPENQTPDTPGSNESGGTAQPIPEADLDVDKEGPKSQTA